MTISRTDIEQIKLFLEDMYPLTIVSDRYGGTYSKGLYLAFPVSYPFMPTSSFRQ